MTERQRQFLAKFLIGWTVSRFSPFTETMAMAVISQDTYFIDIRQEIKESLCVQFQMKTSQHDFIVHNSRLAVLIIKRLQNLSFSTHTGTYWQKYPNTTHTRALSKVTDRPAPLFMTQSCPMSTSRQVWTHFPRIPTELLCIAEHERRGVLL